MSERTPWARMLSLGAQLGLAPHLFWRLSLREWRSLNAPPHQALNRAAFEALAATHPDKPR
ncbi:MAG: phage tail assembly chaperone [Vitreimonas sp.]